MNYYSKNFVFQFAEEDYTLNDVLNNIGKEDLRYLKLR